MKNSINIKITFPFFIVSILVIICLILIYINLNDIIKVIDLYSKFRDISENIEKINVSVRNGILTNNYKYAINSANLSRNIFSIIDYIIKNNLLDINKMEEFKRYYISYFIGVVSINSLFNENRLDQAIAKIVELEKLSENIEKQKNEILLEINNKKSQALKIVLMIILISFILLIIITIFVPIIIIPKQIIKPVKNFIKIFEPFSNGDLTIKSNIKSSDELGDLSNNFNNAIVKIRKLVFEILGQSSKIENLSVNLSIKMNETSNSINQIIENIHNIKNQIINQTASVTQTTATMDNIIKGIENLNQLIENQSANVTESSAAIKEMMININNVTQTLIKNNENINNLNQLSEYGKESLEKITSDIQQVAKETEGILEISEVIQDIATQTNLLAMNAAIEAAHAGDSGKGFAIVAEEVRKLAESSENQAKIVADLLSKIKRSIETITNSTDEILNKFNKIDSEIKIISEQENNIRKAMEEQTTGSSQIIEAISQLNDITQRVKSSSYEMLNGSKEVIGESRNMNNNTYEISKRINEISTEAEKVISAVNDVNKMTIENKKSVEILMKEVKKFKVGEKINQMVNLLDN